MNVPRAASEGDDAVSGNNAVVATVWYWHSLQRLAREISREQRWFGFGLKWLKEEGWVLCALWTDGVLVASSWAEDHMHSTVEEGTAPTASALRSA